MKIKYTNPDLEVLKFTSTSNTNLGKVSNIEAEATGAGNKLKHVTLTELNN